MQSSALVALLGVASFVLLAAPLAVMAWSTAARAVDGSQSPPGGKTRALLLCGTVFFGLLFLLRYKDIKVVPLENSLLCC